MKGIIPAGGKGTRLYPMTKRPPNNFCLPMRNHQNIIRLLTHVGDCEGYDQRYAIDPSKSNRELSWGPTTMFADGIKLTIQWYKDHMELL